ncbi:hypothetical protein CWO91_16890 [Bradyrhizobium genosp. SA-3]|uniref:DUF927 domain-containing protein n=1 Tax=Bradyrhizobium genosp. SA-3 TaxID=508868 RepID=UPI00102900EE|nr:DUF927 domain-containing protein [Bradyrhizobium genosp. SA-3]RZN09705.1 hypothetical protein CWO91_16890 [Bradyrhizobium genosp. SA-3]
MLEHAQEYFAKVLPWPQDGDAPAYVNIHWSLDKLSEKTGKPIFTGRAVRSVQEAVNTVKWAMSVPDTRDIYVCLSTQREALQKKSQKGKEYLAPIRAQTNVVALKSLFLDLDAKGEDKNSYGSLAEATAALQDFIAKMDLPKPSVIVTSGGGLHVYWTLDRALTRYEWEPLAFALAEATKQHGLKCDTQCTIDAARILRVPGTLNRKLDAPRPVGLAGNRTGADYTVDRLARSLEPYKKAEHAPALPPKAPIQGVSDLAAGVDMGNAAPIDVKNVAKECAFVRDALLNGGKELANPLWNLTTLIATFTLQGSAAAHVMANQHSGYSQASTQELYERKEREKQAKGLGWPSCKTISASGCTSCQTCPHFSAGKSPLNFGGPPAPPVPPPSVANPATPNSDLPPGYKRLANNIICRIVIDITAGTAHDEPISRYPMFEPSIQVHPTYMLNFNTVTEIGRTTQISLPMKEVYSKDGFKRHMWQQGLVIDDNETKKTMEFLVSWVEKLQQNKQAVVSSSPYGWSVDRKGQLEGFVFGGSLWMPAGDRAAANPDPVLARRYRPVGERDPWIAAAKMITDQGRPELDAILASAFAGPLVRFCNQPGVLMSTYSTESGIGKTTTLKVAQAVWGDPQRAMAGLDDTQNSFFGKMGQIQSLPVYWDELKSSDQHKRFVKLAFTLTMGREKDRMTQGAHMREAGSWQTMMISASNDSIMDYVMSETKQTLAGVYRVFEYEVKPSKTGQGQIDDAVASKIVGKLNDHYGIVGLEYARYLGGNHATIETDVFEFNRALGAELDMSNEERFWRVTITTLLKGAEYANKLGFTEINIKGLKGFLVGVLKQMRGQKASQPVDMSDKNNISNVLAQFLNAQRARHTLKTSRIHTGRGKPPVGAIKILNSHPDRLDTIYVHIGVDDKKLRMSSTFFGDWLQEKGYSRHVMMKSLETEFGVKKLQGRIASGTEFATAIEYLLEIDLAGTQHVNFLDEA